MKTRLFLLTVLGLTTTFPTGRSAAQPAAPVTTPAPIDAPAPARAPAPVRAPAPAAQPATGPAAVTADAPRDIVPPQLVAPAQPAPPFQAVHPAPYVTPVPAGPRQAAPRPPRRYPLAPPQLHAIEPRRHGNAGAPFALGIGGSLLFRDDRAQRVLFDDNRTGALELFASYDVWTPFRSAIVAVGGSLRSETRLDDGAFALRSHAIQADATFRYGVTSWFWPHVRAAVGGMTTLFSQHDGPADIQYEDRYRSAVGTFGGGFTLRTPTRLFETHGGWLASLSLGLLVEGGYTVAKDAHVVLEPTGSSEVTRTTLALGDLSRSGPYLRIMGVLRF